MVGSLDMTLEKMPRPHQRGGGMAKCLCAGDKVGLMAFEKGQYRRQRGRIARPGPQIVGIETGQRKQTVGTCSLFKRPAQRRQRNNHRLFRRG